MTNERRRDKESSAGSHRKRTKLRVKCPRWSIRDVSMALADVAKVEDYAFARVFLSQHELKIRIRRRPQGPPVAAD